MAAMCGNCQAKKSEYEEKARQIKDAQEKAQKARADALKIQSDFSNVVVDGKPIDGDVLSNCISNFSLTISRLQTAYARCLALANSIVCTHLKEEKPGDDNTIAGTYYR